MHCIAFRSVLFRSVTLLYITLNQITLHCMHSCIHACMHAYIHTYHNITLLYFTIHYTTLHYFTIHYTTLHYITLHPCKHACIHTCKHTSLMHAHIHTNIHSYYFELFCSISVCNIFPCIISVDQMKTKHFLSCVICPPCEPVPHWPQVVYSLMVDRFANGDLSNDQSNIPPFQQQDDIGKPTELDGQNSCMMNLMHQSCIWIWSNFDVSDIFCPAF